MDAYGHAKALTGESFLACFLVLLVLLNLSFEFAHAANLCELNCVGKSLTQAARSFLLSLLPLLSLQSSRGTFGQISLNTVQVNETGPGEEGFLELGRLAADMTKGTHEEAKEWVGKVPGGNPHYSPETVDFLKKVEHDVNDWDILVNRPVGWICLSSCEGWRPGIQFLQKFSLCCFVLSLFSARIRGSLRV
eukprot:176148-Hanusia_phi.AAC.4